MNTLDLVFDWLLQASLRASLLALVVLPLQWMLRKHLSARFLHALWLPVLVVALMPVWPQSRWSAQSLIMDPPPSVMPAMAASERPVPLAQDVPAVIERSPGLSARQIGALAWLAGCLGVTLVGLISLSMTLQRFRREASPPDGGLLDVIANLARQLHLRKAPRLCQSSAITSPAVAGLFRPILLLPSSFSQTFTTPEARLVLKHELMHLKRGDLLMNALLCLLMALHWFNPLLWLAFHKARLDREAACDEDVLRHARPDERAAYGHALLKAESAFCPRGWSLGFVGIFDRGTGLRTRIGAIASQRAGNPGITMLAGALMVLMTFLGATQGQQAKTGDQGQFITLEVKVLNIPSSATLSLFTVNTTVKKGFMSMRLGNGMLDKQLALLSRESGVDLLSCPRLVTRDGHKAQIETTDGATPASKDPPFVGLRFTLLPKLQGKSVSLDIDLEHVTRPGQSTRIQTTESLESGSSVLLSDMNRDGQESFHLYIVTPVWSALDSPVAKKLRSIIFPQVQFSGATIEEAVEFFRNKSRTLDMNEPQVSKRGVNLVLNGDAAASKAMIDLYLHDVPLMEALKYTAELAGLDYQIDDNAVVFIPKSKDKVAASSASIAGVEGKAVERAKRIITAQVQFSGASMEEAVEFLRVHMRDREEPIIPGVNLILIPGGGNATISLDLKDVSIWDALKYSAEMGNYTLSADDHSIILTPR